MQAKVKISVDYLYYIFLRIFCYHNLNKKYDRTGWLACYVSRRIPLLDYVGYSKSCTVYFLKLMLQQAISGSGRKLERSRQL